MENNLPTLSQHQSLQLLDLPRMPIEKGHSYGKVLQNQKTFVMEKRLGRVLFLYVWCTPSRFFFARLHQQSTSSTLKGDGGLHVFFQYEIITLNVSQVIIPTTSAMMRRVSAISVAHNATHLLSHIQIDLTFIINHKKCPIYNISIVGRPAIHILLKLGKQCLPCAII